jgi:SAM-dependent methyltransferase
MNDRTGQRPRRPRPDAAAAPKRPAPGAPTPFAEAKPRPVDVVNAYRWLLGREPEDSGVVARHVAAADSNATLRRRMLLSEEFAGQTGASPEALTHRRSATPAATVASAEELAAMQARLAAGWSRLGETAAHHSCLPQPQFQPDRIAANRRAFFATGLDDRAVVEGALARNRIDASALAGLVDFGCGVGRATLHLAAIIPEVAGLDISAPHLAIAREEARARGMDHIAWRRCSPDRPMPVEGCGLWFSRRVLQHCPPPLSRHLLALAFAALRPGGVAIFQLVTHAAGRAARAGAETGPAALHVLPQSDVFAVARAAGLDVLEVVADPLAALDPRRWVSHLFVMRKDG